MTSTCPGGGGATASSMRSRSAMPSRPSQSRSPPPSSCRGPSRRDYEAVHHDRDLAHQRGSKDIFMNILTCNGLVGRDVTDWTGPDALIKNVEIRLGAPNFPGDTSG